MSSFTALPVGQGDSFVLTRDDRVIVVDGGRDRKAIVCLLADHEVSTIDVLVCTHSDSDHASGVAGILENGTPSVVEVWLPWIWRSRIYDLLATPGRFFDELLQDSLAALPSGEHEPSGRWDVNLLNLVQRSLSPEIVNAEPWLTEAEAREAVSRFPQTQRLVTTRRFLEAARAAGVIRTIAAAAVCRGTDIRWFDFRGFVASRTPSGGEAFLMPVNAVERVWTDASVKLGALAYLSLTLENRESLVFLAPEAETEPSVLFTADSDLAFPFTIPGTARGVLSTAPHHGAAANSAAYGRVKQEVGARNVLWIRSDCRSKYRPCPEFLALRTKACTLCRNPSASKQTVGASDRCGTWTLSSGVTPCRCR